MVPSKVSFESNVRITHHKQWVTPKWSLLGGC